MDERIDFRDSIHPSLRHLFPFVPATSGAEEHLAECLQRYSEATWERQVQFPVRGVTFYLDMARQLVSGRVIGVECDGAPFHQDKVRDFCRDALILNSGRVSCIYRIEAWAVNKQLPLWAAMLNRAEPGLFTESYGRALEGLARCRDPGDRIPRLMSRTMLQSIDVPAFLELAKKRPGLSFAQLVEAARELLRNAP